MPEHPNAERRRAIFHAFWDDGDVQPMLDVIGDEYEWFNDIGAGPFRHLQNKDEAWAFSMWWMDFFGGTFRYELIDVCASDDRVVEVLRELGEKDGHVFDNRALYVYEVGSDGRYVSLRTFDQDRDNVAAFWSHYPEILTMDIHAAMAPLLPAAAT